MYENDVAPQVGKYNGKWVGLPIYLNYNVIYYNKDLLGKYNQDLPKTWDDLIKISEIVIKGEKEKSIVGFNGLVPENELLTCTIQELIHSFRKTPDSPFPGYSSSEAVEALNKYKEIMEKVSSEEIFSSTDTYSITSIISGDILFSKFWNIPYPFPGYDKIVLVGKNEGVSGTTIGGYNLGICKYIDDKNKEAAAKVVEFFTSKEYQKRIATDKQSISAMTSIYDDEEVCNAIDCNFVKQFQPIARPSYYVDDYDVFSARVIENIRKFFNGNLTANEALNNINSIVKSTDENNLKSNGHSLYKSIISSSLLLILIINILHFILI
ncbi:hypothetical protein PIROE2DRAFT_20224 [Piromyces sp. E2]|nr:hypothetical protein PIROE2DRAFT_20224 [Piromyces sp. E2]|eukprot:OUM66092.1 hypothetical protein PIROE2DRAFT_20224 [Piromyces sp. E2]